jgi:mono/diheme cytochrome c family protein
MIALALFLAQSVADPAVITRGERIFAQSCSVGYCHGVGGAAGRGPRLRGRSFPKDYLYNVTRDGIPNSAMPAWKGRLKDDEMRAVVEYVASLASATEAAPPANPMPPGVGPASTQQFRGPAPAARGYALFFDAIRDNCGVCHAVGGKGTAVSPDLTALPVKTPAEVTSAIHASRSRHVLIAKLKDGEEFPAVLADQSGAQVRLYDLTATPPVLRALARSEVASLSENTGWRHSDFVKSYAPTELDDIVIYLRWAATGSAN